MFANVILPLPLQDTYTYKIPDEMREKVRVGCRVEVPFGKKKAVIGIVASITDQQPEGFEVKPVGQVLDDNPIVTESQLRFWQWIATYYICPLGDVMNAALPGGLKDDDYRPKTETRVRLASNVDPAKTDIIVNFLKKNKRQQVMFETFLEMAGIGRKEEPLPVSKRDLLKMCSGTTTAFNALVEKKLIETYEYEIGRINHQFSSISSGNPLNESQQRAFDEIDENFRSHDVVLLHGVTSSGKTEIYIQQIKRAIDSGRQVLYMLPEIALTTQITERLRKVFGADMGVYHSKFTDEQRVEVYKKQLSDAPYRLILGVRSSVFLPFRNLGLVIVDEEHETSYKQQDPAPRYHARSAAVMLARQFGAKTLLGTATPSLETFTLAQQGRYGYVSLTKRFGGMHMPEIEVVDIKRLQFQKRMNGVFSPVLLHSIGEALERGEQVILFHNRRGFASFLQCKSCGWVPRCESCDVSLTYHKRFDALTCHYCGKVYQLPAACPQCDEHLFADVGIGTEKVEAQLKKHFPDARVVRMDIDTTHTRAAYEQVIDDFANHRYDVLVGTQMVSKGLDFDNVSVVGVLDADTLLNVPDFRSHERTFHVLSQVAGRAGRKLQAGRMILQTRSADLDLITQVVNADYRAMYDAQMEERQLFRYPPYYKLIYVFVRHRDAQRADLLAADLARILCQSLGSRVLGPDRPPVSRVQSMHVRKLVIKLERQAPAAQIRQILMLAHQQLMMQPSAGGVQVYYDVDPL